MARLSYEPRPPATNISWLGKLVGALRQIAAEHGGMDAAGAKRYFARLAASGRYQRDAY